ncbi:hypothetical protein A1O1_00440 [Capronia coronata CBS 617.96]|uniref:C2H2-type domain-containing protein n=1 Tax=Capronia coronata CBS 617.96 TaxID=1182541 RepID=W9Z046_9EURO|nr:uncharacterized protein A1O1_00440 [Capronia coronata CBS 617.96]EXJ95320.1 hypothetical protein A1O1_00440 [Capronia coronata CBS 617.96]
MAAHVLPTPATQYAPTQMSYGTDDLHNPNETTRRQWWPTDSGATFGGLQSGDSSYSSNDLQPVTMVSPPSVYSDTYLGRQSSQSPRAPLGVNIRDRTPIRHYQSNDMRRRSHNRSEMLLAYAEQNQLHESQSLPIMATISSQSGAGMARMCNMPTYNMSPPMTNFPPGDDMFASSILQTTAQQEAGMMLRHQNAGDVQTFFPIERTSPHSSQMALRQQPRPDAHNATYAIGPTDTGPQAFPPVTLTLESSPAEIEIRPSRPKPQCWEHGCNGRQFSTFSNLLRHQREKSGSAIKAICPHCGTEFTRTTARNGHMSGGKCKGKADAEASNRAI